MKVAVSILFLTSAGGGGGEGELSLSLSLSAKFQMNVCRQQFQNGTVGRSYFVAIPKVQQLGLLETRS